MQAAGSRWRCGVEREKGIKTGSLDTGKPERPEESRGKGLLETKTRTPSCSQSVSATSLDGALATYKA